MTVVESNDWKVVGKSILRVDGLDKVTGNTVYGSDFDLPGSLVGKILRSPYPHARIVSIDTSAAEALPGVRVVLTGADTDGHTFGFQGVINKQLADKMPLERDKVRFIGDEVAAVAADDEHTALAALDLIDVEYEELPAVFDPFEARKDGAPVIHEGVDRNVIDVFDYGIGDVDQALADADVTVTGTFYSSPVHPVAMETHQALAQWDARGRLTMYASTQMPFQLRTHLSNVLGLTEGDVKIVKMPTGGGFGGRMEMHPLDPIAALLARRAGRPVRIQYSRQEEFQATRFRHPIHMKLTLGAKADGTMTAFDLDMLVDSGAYVAQACGVARVGSKNAMSLYRVANTRVHSEIAYTNNPYASAYRGYGNPQVNFAHEVLVTELAEKLGMDELELRIQNGNHENSETYFGQLIGSCEYEEVIRSGRELSGWDDIHGKQQVSGSKVRGLGMASCINVGGGARDQGDSDSSGCVVIMQDDGSVTVNTGGQEIGSGGATVFSQIVAEELGVAIDRINLEQSDTDVMPWDIGAHAQRNVFCGGHAVLTAAREAKKVLLEEIVRQLECAEEDVSVYDSNVYIAGIPEPQATLQDIARGAHFRTGGQLIWGKGFYDPPTVKTDPKGFGNQSAAYTFGAQFAEVEVDVDTGHVDVVRLVGINDVGVAINPAGVEGQIEGGALQGIGQATTELMHIEDGELLNSMMHNYGVPTALDAPPIVAHIVESSEPTGPFGAKGVGEATVVPTCAAVSNAVYDAIGVRITELPLSPERVLEALDEKEGRT